MAAPKGNKYAQKHSAEHIIAVLTDCIEGMRKYSCQQTPTGKIYEGYSCLERGLASHGHYEEKMSEWAETHKDNAEVSSLIKEARSVARQMIMVNTIEGHYSTPTGIFLMKAKLGMVEKGVQDQNEATKTLLQVQSVPPKKHE